MAVTKMSLHYISFETFVELCEQRLKIAIAIIWYTAREAAVYAHHLVDAGRRSPLERIVHFLLEMHVRRPLDTLRRAPLKYRCRRRASVTPLD
jgi:CRP-like cAMP-binding protein